MAATITPIFDASRTISTEEDAPEGLSAAAIVADEKIVKQHALAEHLTIRKDGQEVLYPMLTSIRMLEFEFERYLLEHISGVQSAWNRVVREHRTNSAVREYLAVPGPLLEWVDRSSESDYRVDFCRFDLVGGQRGDVRVVEFNANCPGGVLFTGFYKAAWLDDTTVGRLLHEWGARKELIQRREWFVELIEASASISKNDVISIFHQPGGNVLEIEKMRQLLQGAGYRTIVTDPSAEDWRREGARVGYLKYGVQATLRDMDTWGDFLAQLVAGDFTIPNTLPGRWIGDNKLCLAALSDPRFSSLFTATELRAIEALIPTSRKVGDGISAAELVRDRGGWVLKTPYDTQGLGVYPGRELDPIEWARLANRAEEEGWLAQALVEPGRRAWGDATLYEDLSVVLLRGQFGGYASRISENFKVNVAQGGGRQIVFGNSARV